MEIQWTSTISRSIRKQVVELFPTDVRNAGVGLSYNIGMCIFGGFAPLAFQAAQEVTWLPGLLLAASGGGSPPGGVELKIHNTR